VLFGQQYPYPGPADKIRSDEKIDTSVALMYETLEMFLGVDNE